MTNETKGMACEICEKPTKKWNFACRDERGMMAEAEIICKDCHDIWCMCSCPLTKSTKSSSSL